MSLSMNGSSADPERRESPFGPDNPFRDNPYAAPATLGPMAGGAPFATGAGRGLIGHVPAIAILMIVQGGLEIVMGGMLLFLGIFLPLMMQGELAQEDGGGAGLPPGFVPWMMLGIYGGLGLVTVALAIIRIVAGLRNYRFRSRTLGLIALVGGMATMFTCYCAPTSVALGIYGLITYVNPQVVHAFALGAAGRSKDEIEAAFR